MHCVENHVRENVGWIYDNKGTSHEQEMQGVRSGSDRDVHSQWTKPDVQCFVRLIAAGTCQCLEVEFLALQDASHQFKKNNTNLKVFHKILFSKLHVCADLLSRSLATV